MDRNARLGGGIVGLIFLALAVLKFLQGGNWVVWLILGLLFGGLSAASQLLTGKGGA